MLRLYEYFDCEDSLHVSDEDGTVFHVDVGVAWLFAPSQDFEVFVVPTQGFDVDVTLAVVVADQVAVASHLLNSESQCPPLS